MRLIFEEVDRRQRYVRYLVRILRDNSMTLLHMDLPSHVEGKRYFINFLEALGIRDVEIREKE